MDLLREQVRREHETEKRRVAEAAPAPAPPAALTQATPPAQVLALQRGMGNAAVAQLLRLVNPTPVETHTVAEVRAMSLGAFAKWARDQADWHARPEVAAIKDDLRVLLEWGEAGAKKAADGPARELNVGALLALPFNAANQKTLRAYTDAADDDGLQIDSAGDKLDAALRWGRALEKLVPAIPKGVLKRTVQQNATWGHLEYLTGYGADYTKQFVDYVTGAPKPLLDSDREVYSFWELIDTEHMDPNTLKGTIQNVRNLHRFHKTSLEALKDAWTKGNAKGLPFTLVLYPALDWNGAFHRDPHIDEVLKNDKNFTLLIEGAKTIADITTVLPGLVTTYGKKDGGGTPRLQQVMIAGHGWTRGMELAGDAIPGHEGDDDSWTRNKAETLDLDDKAAGGGAQHANDVFKALLDQMDPADPHSRILLNACLTASADFQPGDKISTSRRKASTQVAAIVAARPAFADVLRDQAQKKGFDPKKLVSAANASFTAEAELIDPVTGELRLASPANYDPQLANMDRMEYIKDGSEPEGYMRAVLEHYGTRRPEVVKALRAKLASAERAQWPDRVTRAFARVSLYRIHEPHILAAMIEASPKLGELNSDSSCTVEAIKSIPAALVRDLFPRLVEAPHNAGWTSTLNIRLVVLQRWAMLGGGHDTALLSELATATAETTGPKVDLTALKTAGAFNRLASGSLAGPVGEGRLRLLLLDALDGAPTHTTLSQLRKLRGRRADFLPAVRTRIEAALGGKGSADSVLSAIEEPAAPVGGGGGGGGGGRPAKDANVDLDGDGTNDAYVEPLTRRGANAATDVEVLDQPKAGAAVIKKVAKGTTLLVIGRSDGGFLAIEEAGKTRFVREADLPLL